MHGAQALAEKDDISATLPDEIELLQSRVAELEELVSRDTLTPLYNRRHFDEEIVKWIARTDRYGHEHVLLFLDIDNLKAINDRHGHVIGDRLLIAVGAAIAAQIRRCDFAARIGGDEFVVLIEHIGEDDLSRKVDALNSAVSAIRVEGRDTTAPVTCSCAIGKARIQPGDNVESLLDRADQDMYRAK